MIRVIVIIGILFVVVVGLAAIFCVLASSNTELDDEEQMAYLEEWKRRHNVKDL